MVGPGPGPGRGLNLGVTVRVRIWARSLRCGQSRSLHMFISSRGPGQRPDLGQARARISRTTRGETGTRRRQGNEGNLHAALAAAGRANAPGAPLAPGKEDARALVAGPRFRCDSPAHERHAALPLSRPFTHPTPTSDTQTILHVHFLVLIGKGNVAEQGLQLPHWSQTGSGGGVPGPGRVVTPPSQGRSSQGSVCSISPGHAPASGHSRVRPRTPRPHVTEQKLHAALQSTQPSGASTRRTEPSEGLPRAPGGTGAWVADLALLRVSWAGPWDETLATANPLAQVSAGD